MVTIQYTYYDLPNRLKEDLYLDPSIYTCIDNVDVYNATLSKLNWRNIPTVTNSLRNILGVEKKRGWYDIVNRLKDIVDFINTTEC